MLVLLVSAASAWMVARPAVAPVTPAAVQTPALELADRAAGFAPIVFDGPRQVAPPLSARRSGLTFAALCSVGALLGYGVAFKRREAAFAVVGKRAAGTPESVQRTGLGAPVMQLNQYGYNGGRRDAAFRLQNRSYEASLRRQGYGPLRGGYSRAGNRGWKRNAQEIFVDGLHNLARDPLGWLDLNRPSYLRGNGLEIRGSRRPGYRESPGNYGTYGRSLGDGVVSRTYGKRNLYETDAERAARERWGNTLQGQGQNEYPPQYLQDVNNRPGVFEGPRKRDYYFEEQSPGYFEGPGANWNTNLFSQRSWGWNGRNETARRNIADSQWQARAREQGISEWRESAQGPQSSIRQSEAHNAYNYLRGGRSAQDRAAYRAQRMPSTGRSFSYDPVEDAPRQSWARNAEARDAARRLRDNSYDSGYSGRIVPSPQGMTSDYAYNNDNYAYNNNQGW